MRDRLSVVGQRMWPAEDNRFDLLKVVASSPARLASPEVDRPFRAASASMASHICLCENMRASTRTFCHKRCWIRKIVPWLVPAGKPSEGLAAAKKGCETAPHEALPTDPAIARDD